MTFRLLSRQLVLFGTYIWILSNPINVSADETACGDDRYCVSTDSESSIPDSDCVDLHSLCHEWAHEGECLLNPEYMKAACKYSCLLCLKEESRKEDGLDKQQINQIKIFEKLDLGVSQSLPADNKEEKLKTQEYIVQMDMYSKGILPDLIAANGPIECFNANKLCSYWATTGRCDKDSVFMLDQCSLACMTCDLVSKFKTCRNQHLFTEHGIVLKEHSSMNFSKATNNKHKNIDELFLDILTRGTNRAVGKAEVLTMPIKNKDDVIDHNINSKDLVDNPWIVKIDDFVSNDEAESLISLAESGTWDLKETTMGSHEPKVSTCKLWAKDNKEKTCMGSNKVFKNLIHRISTMTSLPIVNFENVEMLKYGKYEAIPAHHDYLQHDSWKPAGPRVLTASLILSDVEQGGATGFPELDWLSINPTKGQLLLWPNVSSSNHMDIDSRIITEGLPVLKGTKYVINVWIHLGNWKEAFHNDCT